ncbi:MAG: STAS domain-containing protein [Deltaproteobacteria bacterium]|nr:STAS domain-containing protein [Deltaproteobacteria bacterium]
MVDSEQGSLSISRSKIGSSNVLIPKESLTYENNEELKSAYDELVSQGENNVILDCKSMTYLDSAALETLLDIHNDLTTRGGSLKITGLNEVCQDILIVTRLTNYLIVYNDIQEAVKSDL